MRHAHASWAYLPVVFLLLPFLVALLGKKPIPPMQEVIDAFADRAQRAAVIAKYGDPGVVPAELGKCEMAKPVILKTEEQGGLTVYTVESRVEECTDSPAAKGTVRIFSLGWKDGRIRSFAWGGPKGGKVEY